MMSQSCYCLADESTCDLFVYLSRAHVSRRISSALFAPFSHHIPRRPTLGKAQEKLWRAKQLLALAAPPSIVVLVLKHTCL
jgi:hypothetical protein